MITHEVEYLPTYPYLEVTSRDCKLNGGDADDVDDVNGEVTEITSL